jgi:transmembrane sensor
MPTESHSSAGLPPKPDERTPLDWPRDTGRIERVLEAIELRKKRVQRRRARLVVGAAFALLIASVARYGSDRPLPSAVAPPANAARSIIAGPERRALPDGSFAEINPGSEVTVEFTAAQRRVVLRRGEAHFQVVPDATRPFIVAAGGMEFRAVGTAFAVQLSGTKVEMVVTQGKVAVDRKAALPAGSANDMPPATLAVVAAGQHVAVDLATRAMVAPIVTPLAARESDQKLSWRVPRLQLNDTPLREVVAAINAHTAARLELADAELGSLEVCGVLRVDNIDTLLTMLERNYGVRAERNDAGVAILRRVSR